VTAGKPLTAKDPVTAADAARILRETFQRVRQWPPDDQWAEQLALLTVGLRGVPAGQTETPITMAQRLARQALRDWAVLDRLEQDKAIARARRAGMLGDTLEDIIAQSPPEQALRIIGEAPPKPLKRKSKAWVMAAGVCAALHAAKRPVPSFTNKGGPGVAAVVAFLELAGTRMSEESVVRALRGFTCEPPRL
jgi:hypothetical protein